MKENDDIPADWPEKTTIGALVHECAGTFGDKTALMYRDPARILTFRDLDAASDAVAKSLIASGIAQGTHAAVWAPNIPEWLIVSFGCAKAGIPIICLNTNFRAYDLEYILKLADVDILFLVSGSAQPGDYTDALYEICPELKDSGAGNLKSRRLPRLKTVVLLGDEQHPGMLTWQEFLSRGEPVSAPDLHRRISSVRPDDGAFIFLTSGTTGRPKCALWRHARFIGNMTYLAEKILFTPDDVCCIPLPFFHVYGCGVTLSSLFSGCTVAPVVRFNAREFLTTIESSHATQVFGTPTMFVAALDELGRAPYDTSSLKGGNMGGSVSPPALVGAVIEKMGAEKFGILYGMTEILLFACGSPRDSQKNRIGSIGRPSEKIRSKIIIPATGTEVPPGQQGELLVHSPWTMSEYYHNPEATAELIDAEGFVHTGDIAFVDRDGYYHITGRSKDLIIRGGDNISPSEIEGFLLTHPAVLDAQVVGIRSGYFGEEPLAFVRLKPGQAVTALGLKQFCRRNIDITRVPADFLFVDQYPLTASGKVQKFRLREMAEEMLARENH